MTTPNQPAPTWMELVGLGAFEIGGSGGGAGLPSFGQGVTSDAVTQVISGPATALMNIDGVAAQSDVLTLVSNYLSTLPLQALQMFQGFLPGKTAADFVDVPTAVTTIMGALGLGSLSGTSTALARLMTDLMVLFDVFHTTYQAGTSGDAPGTLGTNGKPTWYSCWNDILSMVGLWTGTSAPTTPAPTIGTAITAAGTAGSNGSSWSTSLTNDLTVLLDVFHVTYSSTQWNAAWADLLSLFGIVNSVSTPTNPTPTIGPAITSAQASATTATTNAATAQTTANTGNTNTGTFLGYTRILSDVFHLTYNVGSSSDTPTTLGAGGVGNGKPTWYSAWNGLLILEGLVKSVSPPTDTAPTTGAVIAANTAAATTAGTNASIAIANASAVATTAQAITDGIFQSQNGGSSTGNATSTIVPSLTAIPASNIVGSTGAAVAFGAVGGGNAANFSGGTTASISWSHTIATGDLGVLVIIAYEQATGGAQTSSVTYGGAAMTMQQRETSSGTFQAVIEAWWLKSPPSGTKTVAVSLSAGNFNGVAGDSVSYSASKIVTVGPNLGGGSTSLSMSAASATGHMVVGAFANVNGVSTSTLSAYNKTQRYNNGATDIAIALGDAAGASSVSFTATSSGTAANIQWAGITVDLSN